MTLGFGYFGLASIPFDLDVENLFPWRKMSGPGSTLAQKMITTQLVSIS